MAFGRRKPKEQSVDEPESVGTQLKPEAPVEKPLADDLDGPFDIEDFDDSAAATEARLDLGAVLLPLPPEAQLQVELTETGVPSAVWVVTANGRFTIAAYAAPKTGGLWREVAGELAESLRKDGATVSIQDGRWGREVVGTATGVVRFIGVDGYRWMIRCVGNAAAETVDSRRKILTSWTTKVRPHRPSAAVPQGRRCSSCAVPAASSGVVERRQTRGTERGRVRADLIQGYRA